jgi:uncharacterized membrane protein YqgA involved in biofilm formation
MHFNLGTALIATTLLAAIYLLLEKRERMVPAIAVVVTGVELLLAMGLMSLSLSKFRIDVIMPALVVGSGVVCWARSSEKGSITAATGLTVIGAIQLVLALHILS